MEMIGTSSMFFGGLFFLVLLLVIMRSAFNQTNSNRARKILDERFARGEIKEEEYFSKKKMIDS
jgi:uncharacterized membrane protein